MYKRAILPIDEKKIKIEIFFNKRRLSIDLLLTFLFLKEL